MKRTMLLVLTAALLLMAFASAEESASTAIAVNFENTASLIAPDGSVLVPAGRYESIFSVGLQSAQDTRFAAGGEVDGQYLYALMDETGKTLTAQEYEMLSYENGYVLFLKDGLYGAMRETGEILFPAQYTSLATNGADGFLGTTTDCWDDEPDGIYYIDITGKSSATGVKTLGPVGVFSEGMMPLLSTENNKYGYVGTDGQWEIRPQFEYADAFLNGYASASLISGTGLINATGNWALTPKYDYIYHDCGDVFLAVQDGNLLVVFNVVTRKEYFRVSKDNLYADCMGTNVQVYAEDGVYLYDYEGNVLYQGDALSGFAWGENGQTIVYEGEWGADCVYLLEKDGSVIAGPYQQLTSLGTVSGKAYYAYMTFDVVESYSQDLGENVYDWSSESARYGMIDGAGNEIFPAEYTNLYRLSDAYLYAETEDTSGVITVSGEWVYSIQKG